MLNNLSAGIVDVTFELTNGGLLSRFPTAAAAVVGLNRKRKALSAFCASKLMLDDVGGPRAFEYCFKRAGPADDFQGSTGNKVD